MEIKWNHWKFTAIGMGLVTVTALVTGLVVASWRGADSSRPAPATTATATSPSASPNLADATHPTNQATTPPAVAQAPAAVPAPGPARSSGVPTQAAIDACNRYASAQSGPAPATTKDKTIDIVKDAAVGAVGGAAVGALGGAIAGGGKGAGKGAAIGGLVGGGGGTLYGIYAGKQHDEKFRTAYSGCMRQRGYTG